MTIEATDAKNIKFSYLTKFESEIRRFDTVMDLIQKFMPDDWKVWDRIAVVRDAVFKLILQPRRSPKGRRSRVRKAAKQCEPGSRLLQPRTPNA